ncbi:MAG TPA: hypothetical protein VFT54_07450 [Acidimicrobiia bacterium]|nr:hypothetical protein [Acidimicrobiia bacterium]
MTTTEVDDRLDDRVGSPSLLRLLPVVFTVISLLGVVAVHVPWLPIGVQAAGHSLTNHIGQEVRWNMFSADPRGTALDLWASIEFDDGTSESWRIDRPLAGGELREYRWVKWMETAVLLKPEDQLQGLAGWLASQSSRPVSRITIFGSERPPSSPGASRPQAVVSVLLEVDVADLSPVEASGG